MIKDNKLINHTIRLDFNIGEAAYEQGFLKRMSDLGMLDAISLATDTAAKGLLSLYGITEIKDLKVTKI